jgi:hypothetical protein
VISGRGVPSGCLLSEVGFILNPSLKLEIRNSKFEISSLLNRRGRKETQRSAKKVPIFLLCVSLRLCGFGFKVSDFEF